MAVLCHECGQEHFCSNDCPLKLGLCDECGPSDSSNIRKYPVIVLCHESAEKDCPVKLELCNECGKEHSLFISCPNIPYKICYKEDHYLLYCPFLDNYRRGEDFDTTKYEIVCQCGYPFDTDKWLCTFCPCSRSAKLQLKRCEICKTTGDHIIVECPENKELADACKSELDALLATRKFYPYRGKSAAAASSGDRRSQEITKLNPFVAYKSRMDALLGRLP